MNNFTKEELLVLFKCVRISEMEYGEHPDLDNAKFKLQSLIDNYCEHDWREAMCEICDKCDAMRKY